MLVFFIHGVATRDAKYSNPLIDGIKKEFSQADQKLPYFYASFWGHVLNDFNKIWNSIDEDLSSLEKRVPGVNAKDAFRYRQFREGLISEFAGDMFTYMNEYQGREVRRLIADQLYKFIEKHPEEEEIHIIAHSLGTVILWDILFSDKFKEDDPAHTIRGLISTSKSENKLGKAGLIRILCKRSRIPILEETASWYARRKNRIASTICWMTSCPTARGQRTFWGRPACSNNLANAWLSER